MPEYPEVVTVKNSLNKTIRDKKIKNINIKYDKILRNTLAREFKSKLVGQVIKNVDNYGKYLIIRFSDYDLLIHLRMEGKLFFYDYKKKITKHNHIIFEFCDNTYLIYDDVRKFGTMDLFKSGEYKEFRGIKKLGKEPLDTTLDLNYLKIKLNNSKKIKQNLLDQQIINGLGNIYVDEILYKSNIHPESVSQNLSSNDINLIITNMQEIIKKAIKYNGTTIKSFSATDQIKGSYQKYLNVYQQHGNKCCICKKEIKKIKVAGRGTHYCPGCQRKI